jgi:Tol biopolymer transport system component
MYTIEAAHNRRSQVQILPPLLERPWKQGLLLIQGSDASDVACSSSRTLLKGNLAASDNRHVLRSLLVAIAFVFVFGASAAGRTGEQAAQPRTLAQVRGSVDAIAQNGRRIAWCGRQVQILMLPGRRPAAVGSRRGRCELGAIALSADGRVLWQGVAELANTYFVIDLLTAALRDPRTRLVTHTHFDRISSPDHGREPKPLPMAADGNAILFYASCEAPECTGSWRPAIYRLAARRSSRLAKITSPVGLIGLAVSGRRFAVVTDSFRCCSSTPAWSHDGTRLAWIYHGDLWTIRADGTGDRKLAARVSPPYLGSGDARRPSWSPDDERLVFERTEWDGGRLRSRGVYRVGASGGGLRRLGAGTAPAWSPDGTRVAFVRGSAVFSINPDGAGARRLTAAARATAGPLPWSPDSTRIAVSRGGDIYSVRADGSGEMRLTSSRGAETQPAWSPDGARIAYVDGSVIAAVNADGTGATRLTRATEGDGSPSWSPDSQRIAFVRREPVQGVLWTMNADGSSQRRLDGPVDSPQWAPGGSSIAVGDWYDGLGNWPYDPGIHLVSPVDGKARKIAPLLHSTVEIRDALTGRLIKRFTIGGHARATALGPDYVALLVNHEPGVRVELHNLNGSFRSAAAVPASVRSVSAAGRTVVFATGHVIRRLDARTGAVTALANASRTPVGLTIEGRRVAWAENGRGGARIRAFTAP